MSLISMNMLDRDLVEDRLDRSDYFCRIFNELDLSSHTVSNTLFESCLFQNSDLSHIQFKQCRFINCIFHNCNLNNIQFNESSLTSTRFC